MADVSSIVSALGAGSGIDMVALASNLANAQFQFRTERLAARSDTLERQISSASSIKNTLSLLATAMGERVRGGDLSPKPEVANASVASASSPLGTTGKGSYSLEVLALAQSQTLASRPMASADTATGGGTMVIRFGQTNGSSFTADNSHTPLTLDIPANATLADVARTINQQGAGVSAYVAQTTQGAQLVLKGSEGQKSGFIVEATKTSGARLLSNVVWNGKSEATRLLSAATDASFKLDGLAMTSPSNETGEVAPGLKLALTATNVGAPTKITFGNPAAGVSSAMQDFVGALNEVAEQLRSATDPLTGDLSRDPGARALKRALSQLGSEVIMPSAAAGAPRTLAELGLATQRDGSFTLDVKRLQATLEREPEGVAAMFTSGLYGVYASLDRISRNATTTGNPGSLGGSIARYQAQSTKTKEDTADLAGKQEALRASLTARFVKADTRISASQSTLTFLKSQIDAWNGSGE